MKNIYGTIGYSLLENSDNKNKIIIMADNHDYLNNCNLSVSIDEWFKSKFNSSKIFLEEVPREDFELEELWPNSPHTQSLKELYLSFPKIINGVDIRPFLTHFSWELFDLENNIKDMTLKEYLSKIDEFFKCENKYIIEKIPFYNKYKLKNTKLGKHFLIIKNKFGNYLLNNKNLLEQTVKNIHTNDIDVLLHYNNILDEIMEWFICALIYTNIDFSIILHTGLSHSEKVVDWLLNHYNYKLIKKEGTNKLNEMKSKLDGCIRLPTDIDYQFGGFYTI
jgi:hypothetical protein